MANAQHPRFQGTQRLNHASQRPLHASSQRFHVADVNSHPQQRTAQQSYGCDFRECGYDDGQWQRHGNSYDVHNWQPGGKGQARGMRLPMQTPPNNGYYPQQGEDHQQYQSRTPQEYAPLYQPEHLYKNRPKGHANGFQDDGGPTAYHNPSDNSDHACQNHSYGHNYDHRATPDGYGNGISQGTDTHGSIPGHPAAQMSSATTTQPNTAKSDFLPRTKPHSSGIIQTQSPSDTIAWDNPSPTFPLRSSQGAYSSSRSLDGFVKSMSLNDESRYGKDPYRRPNTAGGKRIHAISPNGNEKLDEKGLQNGLITQQPVDRHGTYREKGYFEHQPQAQRHFEQCQGIAQVRPVAQEVGRYAARIDQLEAPIANGRDWEDNRTRPSTPHDIRIRLGYERSKTMPTALSEIVPKPGQQRKYPEELRWQEPGPTAGYYGPEDRGYTPTSPANLSKQRLAAQSQKQSDEKRLGEKIAKFDAPNLKPHQQHDSLGEFFDNYYDASQQEYQPQFEKTECQLRGFAEGDLPNFDGVPDAERRTYRTDPYANGQPPRSKSQPSSQDRPPRQRHENEFDFGILCGPSRPPATAPARTGFGPSTIRRMNAPNNSPQLGDQHLRGRNYQGRMPASNYRFNHNPANFPLPRARQPAPANQGKAPPDQYTSPPDGFSREGQMKPLNDRLSPTNRIGPTPSPIGLPSNPDALPPHATPVPPGLKERSPVNQPIKPPPIRQYNTATIPLQLSGQSGNPKDSSYPASMKKVAVPVTHQELERLRQATTRKPDDHVTQLALAKKLVEAASVLVDERADSKTRNKNREKYILDGHRIVKKLSNIGYADASFYLADCYSRGALGLEANSREAFKLYQSAAKAGHAQAAYRVAVCCEIGQEEDGGTRRDAGKAMQWYERAATLGDTSAMYKMGIIFLKGLLGQPKNPREAIVLLKRAVERADEDNPHALHELALLYEKPSGTEGVTEDKLYSKQLFTQAANLGYKSSQFRLGRAYEYGLLGCPVDPRQSIAWYSKAAVQQEHQSELALSGWHLTGSEGVLEQSDTEAYLWARRAAQAGLAKAEYAMGYFTEVGIGTASNIEDAKRWVLEGELTKLSESERKDRGFEKGRKCQTENSGVTISNEEIRRGMYHHVIKRGDRT